MPVDISDLLKGLDGLVGLKESLARRMGVSAGIVVRDEAKENAPIGDPFQMGYGADWKTGSTEPGALKESIYLAYNEKQTTKDRVVYSVSWNAKKAFWGVFMEFGFVMSDVTLGGSGVGFWTLKGTSRIGGPLNVKAHPFLAPALDQNISRIAKAAIDRGKEEFPKLLQEIKK